MSEAVSREYQAERHTMPAYAFIERLFATPEWMDKAACKNTVNIDFFDIEDQPRALAFCASCPVVVQCQQLAEDSSMKTSIGVWGGRPSDG